MDTEATFPPQNNTDQTNQSPHPPQSPMRHWLVLILLLTFPPLAWRYMWKDHRYHSWFLYILVLNGLGMLGLFGYFLFFAYPELVKLFQSLNIPQQSTQTIFLIHIVFLILGIFELLFGIYLKVSRKDMQVLSKPLMALIIFLFFLNLLALPISQAAIASGFYNLTSVEINSLTDNSIKPTTIPSIPTSDSVKNWKTYSNNKYFFSLEYPTDWVIYEEPNEQIKDDGTHRVVFRSVLPTPVNPRSGLMQITISKQKQSISEYIATNYCEQNVCVSIADAKKITIDGITAYRIDNSPEPVPGIYVIFDKDDMRYVLEVTLDENDTTALTSTQKEQIFNHMISTFKFLVVHPSPTCIPRPACLDSEPRCMIPETEGMCPKATPTL